MSTFSQKAVAPPIQINFLGLLLLSPFETDVFSFIPQRAVLYELTAKNVMPYRVYYAHPNL